MAARLPDESRISDTVAVAMLQTGDINGTNRNGDTALHAAAAMGYDRVITMLAAQGASLNIKNNRGQTPLKAARSNTAELLRRLGAVE